MTNIYKSSTILPLITEPNPLLHQVSIEVKEVNLALQNIMNSMLASLYHYKGIGIAAVQLGILQRIIVIDIDQNDIDQKYSQDYLHDRKPLFLVNPIILELCKETQKYEEGCLSLPGIYSDIIRPQSIVIQYLDYHGESHKRTMTGLLATCVQHEMDHLNGIVFIDHLSRIKREFALKKYLRQIKTKK